MIIPGATNMLRIGMAQIPVSLVGSIIFTLNKSQSEATPTLQKRYESDWSGAVKYIDSNYCVPLTQEDTALFAGLNFLFVQAQINFTGDAAVKPVSKTLIERRPVGATLATELVEGNGPDLDQEDYFEMTIADAIFIDASMDTIAANVALSQTAADEAKTARNESVAAKDTAVEQANSASINKDATDNNVSTTTTVAQQVTADLQAVTSLVAECQAVLQQQYQALATMPTTYWVGSLSGVYEIVNPKEMDTCFVASADKQSLYMYYTKDIEGNLLSEPAWVFVTDLNLLSLNRDYLLNILQLPAVATSGSYTDLINKPNRYESFATISDGVWDYAATDKIILTADLVSINNVYNGAVGVVKSSIDITLPANSKKSIDYDYMDLAAGEAWLYTFVYDGSYFHWSRVVCS